MTVETSAPAGAGQQTAAGAGGQQQQQTGAGAQQTQQQTQRAPWYDGIVQNDETKAWLAQKGYPDAAATIESHRNLEKLLGSDQRVIVPTDPNDKAGWDKVWNQLGRPDSADKYVFQAPEGYEVNKDLSGGFAKAAHAVGVTQAQAKALFDWYIGAETEATGTMKARSESEMTALKTEWGAAFDQKLETGRRAAREFGVADAEMNAIEAVIGTAKLMKLFNDIGSKLGEHSIEGKGSTQFTMTPAQADAEISRLRGDPAFLTRYQNSDPKVRQNAIDEMARLQRMKAGEKP